MIESRAPHHQPLLLLVDDDADMRLLLKRVLSRRAYRVVEAVGGEQALTLCGQEVPSLVLMDAGMPGMDGFAACQALKRLPGCEHLPVIMVTGLGDEDSVERAFAAGAEDFVTKPVHMAVLQQRIRLLLERRMWERRLWQRDQQFRLLMRHTPAAMAMFDRDMHYLQVSHRWLDDHNLDPDTTIGASHYELIPDEARKWREIHERCLAGAWERHTADRFVNDDGSEEWITWEAFPWRRVNGEVGGLLLFADNVTDQVRMERQVRWQRDKLSYERGFIEEIIVKMRASTRFDGAKLRYLLAPVEKTAGDLLLSARRPDGAQHVMLGDFTGHGLTAALGGPLVSDIFYSMTGKGLAMDEIVAEINRQLHQKMPVGMFMAASFVEVAPGREWLRVWNCAMPELLLFRGQQPRQRIESSHPPLGIIGNLPYAVTGEFVVGAGDLLYTCSDGVVEVANRERTQLGMDVVEKVLAQVAASHEPLAVITKFLDAYRDSKELEDDISVVEIAC